MTKKHTDLEPQGEALKNPDPGDSTRADRVPDQHSEAAARRQLDIEVDIEALSAELAQLQSDLQEHKEKYLRAMAEVENTRRRAQSDVAAARKFAVEGFASEVLLVRDSLELARSTEVSEQDSDAVRKMNEGLDLTLKQMDSVLSKFGIREITPQTGDKLDPELHQAMTVQESGEVAPNHILSAVQKGYSIHDRLLRPAMVIVAKAPSRDEAEAQNS